MRYYNPADGGFYTSGLNLPVDADLSQYIPLSETEFSNLMAGQGVNGMIMKVVNGRPALGPPDAPSGQAAVDLAGKKKASLLASAVQAMAPYQAAADLNIATASETAMLNQWKNYLVMLNRVDVTAATITWPVAPTTASSGGGVTVVS